MNAHYLEILRADEADRRGLFLSAAALSVWRDKDVRTLLAVPKAARQGKVHGDTVKVRLAFSAL